MLNFLHTFHPQPVMFQFGPITIYWYGLLVVLGVLAGLGVVLFFAKRYGIKSEAVFDLAFYLLIFGFLGARLYEVLILEPAYFFSYPAEIFKVWRGGLAIHGLIFAGILTLIVYCHKRKQSFWLWADILAPALVLGQAIGRWGNYFNQEIFGLPSNLPWGIPIDFINRVPPYLTAEYFHPTFLYESILNFLIFGILIFLHYRRFKKNNSPFPITHYPYPKNFGNIFLVYLILYSLVRFFLEFIRIDETPLIFGWRLPQVMSGLVILGSLGIWWWRRRVRISSS